MLSSMTGFGQASLSVKDVMYVLEVRSLNGKYLKSTIRVPEFLSCFEPRIEQLLRKKLLRGTVYYSLRIKGDSKLSLYEVNSEAIQSYLQTLHVILLEQSSENVRIDLGSILALPGITQPASPDPVVLEEHWKIISELTNTVLEKLCKMREEEGKSIKADLEIHCGKMRKAHESITERAELVVDDYAQRLRQRVNKLLSVAEIELRSEDLAREVAIFAERADINEELSRLDSHLRQFETIMDGKEHSGRKLEFLAQELLRETNTIGSKANDAQIAQKVVEIKGHIDRIKEQTLNIV